MLSKSPNRMLGITTGHLKRTTSLFVLQGPPWEDRRNEDQLAPVAVKSQHGFNYSYKLYKNGEQGWSWNFLMQLGVLWYKTGTEF